MRRPAAAAAAAAAATATAVAAAAATATATAVAAYAVLSLVCLCAPPSAAATPRPALLTRTSHVTFENCDAQHVILSVTVPRHAFTPGEAVTYTVRLRNTGATTCGQALAQIPQARRALTVGPCGTLSTVFWNTRGVNVFPGPVAYGCAAEFGFRLGPHSSASTTGSWNQIEALGSPVRMRHAPPGTYRLVVARAVSVPVTGLTPDQPR